MKISWESSSEKLNVISLYVDEEPWKDVHRSIYKKIADFPKFFDNIEELNDYFFNLEAKYALDFILRKLSRKSYHSKEIEKCLLEVLISKKSINAVINKCIGYGFLNDDAWIKNFINRELLSKHGRLLIVNKLRNKGIPEDIIEEYFDSTDSEEIQKEQILRLIQTKYKNRNLQDFKEKEKTIGSLARRGYGLSLIKEIIEDYLLSLNFF